MTNALASDLPAFVPALVPALVPAEIDGHPRHIEIVSTRRQKRARPRVVYAVVAVTGLFIILMVQLLLSIWLSNGAYQISGLQQTQRELARDQQSLGESLNTLQSPQNLAERASALGMVMNTGSQGFLSLSGGVTRNPMAAAAETTVAVDAAKFTPNALITPDLLATGADGAAGTAAAGTGAPGAPAANNSVASETKGSPTTVLPSPITR